MTPARKELCIFAFSPIYRDARVLRQLEYLAPHYNLTVIGYGPPHPDWADDDRVRWISVPEVHPIADVLADLKRLRPRKFLARLVSEGRRGIFAATLWLGQLMPGLYGPGYRLRWAGIGPLQRGLDRAYAAIHANDWDTVPLAARAVAAHGGRLVADLHEYAPRQWENRPGWHRNEKMIRALLTDCTPAIDASITVAQPLADQYREDFGLDPMVVMNAPKPQSVPAHKLNPDDVRIMHHGLASPVRRPELMIEAIAQADPRYSLHFMFVENEYVETLRALAAARAPGRVTFHPPVRPGEIVARIAEFDVSFAFFPPVTFNYRNALPNKFLESIMAGHAAVIGPSPAMAAIVNIWENGVIAPSFAAADLAATLNRTSAADWERMRANARRAAAVLNADVEMGKVVDLYTRLLADGPDSPNQRTAADHA